MNRFRTVWVPAVAGAAILTCLFARDASAIPAFARKYQLSCSTCHAPFPRLKPYGEKFGARGFKMDPAEEPARATIDVGDPLLRLARDLPLAIRLEGYASWKDQATAPADIEWPWVLKVLSGGPITNGISYYFYALIEQGEIVGLEDAYVQFTAPFKLPLDVMFGQFQVCDPMFKRELRLERFDYEIFKASVGVSQVDLTYDRGVVATLHLPQDFDAVFQLVNGNGIQGADADKNFDSDALKNFSLRLAKPFGKVRLGVFTYFGKEKARWDRSLKNRTWYVGPDLVLDLDDKWQLNVEYLERRDDNPYLGWPQPNGTKIEDLVTRGGFVELHFLPKGQDGRWALSWLYGKVDSDDPNAKSETVSMTMNYLAARNVRLFAEGGGDLEADTGRVSIGLITAF